MLIEIAVECYTFQCKDEHAAKETTKAGQPIYKVLVRPFARLYKAESKKGKEVDSEERGLLESPVPAQAFVAGDDACRVRIESRNMQINTDEKIAHNPQKMSISLG